MNATLLVLCSKGVVWRDGEGAKFVEFNTPLAWWKNIMNDHDRCCPQLGDIAATVLCKVSDVAIATTMRFIDASMLLS